ncbi:MAG TPA: hypothetical protein VFQ35_26640 [Polyangiaceae bacterium]|nr:hypothetical protein [Polyangiaceae bacterium]
MALRGLRAFRVSPNGRGHVAGDNTGRYGRAWTKCTNLALDLLTELVAERSSLQGARITAENVSDVLAVLEQLRTFHGIFPEFIKLEGSVHAEVKAGAVRYSSIDSAWVTVALSIAEARYRAERPDLAQRASELLRRQDYSVLVEGRRLLGFVSIDALSGAVLERARFAYGDRNSEARPLVLALTGLGKLPASIWDEMRYSWTLRDGLPVASGYGASAFVELSGQLFFDEMTLAPKSLGLSHENYVKASAQVAHQRHHSIWGYAPSCAASERYAEFGLDNPDVVAPYAAALLATTRVPLAASNLERVFAALDWSGAPFADSLDPVSQRALCAEARMLDQSLLFLSLNVDALRELSRRTSWYASAEARLRDMDRTHAPELNSVAVSSEVYRK